MGLDRPIDITTDQRKTVLALLASHLPNTTAWVYGSRVKWTARPASDLDVVVFATLEQSGRVSDLREAFEESNLPFRVDLFVWDEVPEQFRKQIEAEHVVLVEKKEPSVGGERRDTAYGLINADFVENRLADLCDPVSGIQTGPFGSQLHNKDYVAVGTPIITVEHLGENRILHQGVPCVSEKDRLRLSKYWLQKDDIVFSRVGSVDRRALVRDGENGWLFSGRCLRVRPNSNYIDAAFLSYFFGLPSFKEHIRAVAVGATMPSLNTQILSDISVPYPESLEEQRSIAHVLGTLDDKIELNRRMNETLEEMARALFKSWFVDFDPVHAKATLNHHVATLPPGRSDWSVERARAYLDRMDPNIAAVFPDRFIDSELGPIPAVWEAGTIGSLAVVFSGKRPSMRYPTASSRASILLWGGNGPMGFVAEAIVDYPVLLTGRVGTLGSVFRITAPCYPSDNTLVLRAKSNISFDYIRFNLEKVDFEALNRGSTQPLLTQGDLKAQPICLPPVSVLEHFNRCTSLIFDKIDGRDCESRTLTALRDTLLPKLMSGKVRIKAIASLGRVTQLAR